MRFDWNHPTNVPVILTIIFAFIICICLILFWFCFTSSLLVHYSILRIGFMSFFKNKNVLQFGKLNVAHAGFKMSTAILSMQKYYYWRSCLFFLVLNLVLHVRVACIRDGSISRWYALRPLLSCVYIRFVGPIPRMIGTIITKHHVYNIQYAYLSFV